MVSVKVSLDLNKFDSCFDCFFRLSITRLHTCLRRLRLLGCWCIMQHGERRQGFPSFEKLPCQSTLQERYCLFSKLYFLCLKASQRFKSKEGSLVVDKKFALNSQDAKDWGWQGFCWMRLTVLILPFCTYRGGSCGQFKVMRKQSSIISNLAIKAHQHGA